MEKWTPCRTCKDSPLKGKLIKGEGMSRYIEDCPCWAEYKRESKKELKLAKANLPISILNKSLDTYAGTDSTESIPKLRLYVNEFNTVYKHTHLYLYGDNGTQKTTIASVVGKELLLKGFSVLKLHMDDLVKLLQSEHIEKTTKEIQKIHSYDLLILDESFARDKVQLFTKADYQISTLTRFLKDRMELHERAVIFISNKTVHEIEKEGFGKSIQSLVSRNTSETRLLFVDEYEKVTKKITKSIWDRR